VWHRLQVQHQQAECQAKKYLLTFLCWFFSINIFFLISANKIKTRESYSVIFAKISTLGLITFAAVAFESPTVKVKFYSLWIFYPVLYFVSQHYRGQRCLRHWFHSDLHERRHCVVAHTNECWFIVREPQYVVRNPRDDQNEQRDGSERRWQDCCSPIRKT